MLGLKRGAVELCPHEKQWDEEAARTIEKLRFLLGSAARRIEHIGSTSVESIAAKPIIDIAVETDSFDSVTALKEKLEKNGFYLRECGLEGQLLLASGSFYTDEGDEQTHFIHVVKTNSSQWYDYINYRDYLRKHIDVAKEYEKIKIRLAAENYNREEYTEGKNEFISRVLKKAFAMSFLGKTVDIVIDRPIGYVHFSGGHSLSYPVNYGYIPDTVGGDGEELDVYLLGVSAPVSKYRAKIIAVVHRKDDVEDKLVAVPEGYTFSKDEIYEAVSFQEKYFNSCIEMNG